MTFIPPALRNTTDGLTSIAAHATSAHARIAEQNITVFFIAKALRKNGAAAFKFDGENRKIFWARRISRKPSAKNNPKKRLTFPHGVNFHYGQFIFMRIFLIRQPAMKQAGGDIFRQTEVRENRTRSRLCNRPQNPGTKPLRKAREGARKAGGNFPPSAGTQARRRAWKFPFGSRARKTEGLVAIRHGARFSVKSRAPCAFFRPQASPVFRRGRQNSKTKKGKL